MVTNWVDGRSSILAGNASGESGQWNLSIGFELTSAFVNRGYAAWKNVADGGPFFRKVGGREPGFRTALCYSADSLTCASGFLEFLRPCTFAFALPSSRQTLSFPKSTINSFSFLLEFVDILVHRTHCGC